MVETKEAIGWPPAGAKWYYSDEWVAIAHGDCREILPELPKVDLVLTDPPFNAGKDFQNDNLSALRWQEFCEGFAQDLLLVSPDNVLVEVNKKDIMMRRTLEDYFTYRYAICLNYTNSMRSGTVGYHNWGLVLWYGDGKCHKRYRDRIDSALHNTKAEFEHPSPKEITHYKKLCEMFSPQDGVTVDPFMGSGTTLIGARELNRKCIGIEINEKYCEIAAKRCSQSVFDFSKGGEL